MRLGDARGRRDYVPPTGVGLIEADSTCRWKLLQRQWLRHSLGGPENARSHAALSRSLLLLKPSCRPSDSNHRNHRVHPDTIEGVTHVQMLYILIPAHLLMLPCSHMTPPPSPLPSCTHAHAHTYARCLQAS